MGTRGRVGAAPAQVTPWPFVGMGAIACVLFLIGASVLFTPGWVVAVLGAVWCAAFVVACRWFTRRPGRVLWLPAGLTLLWFATVTAGARWWW